MQSHASLPPPSLLLEHRRQQEREMEETAELINTFVLSTAQFLNRFAAECDRKLYRVGRALDKLETQTVLLEFKIRSVEGDRYAEMSGDEEESATATTTTSTSATGSSGDRRGTSSSSDYSSSPTTSSSAAVRAQPAVLRIKDSKPSSTALVPASGTLAARAPERATRKSARRGDAADTVRRRPSPPEMPDTRSERPPPPPGIKKGRQPPQPPLTLSAGRRAEQQQQPDREPARYFLLPPLLPAVGTDAGLPLPPPPPPLPRQIRGPNREPGADPKKGSGATYTMQLHPRLRGYFDLVTLKVPVEEVRRRMQENGVDPAWLDTPNAMAPADLSDYVEGFASEEESEEASNG